ncbi:hypothetical protein [Planctomicrobium sp. SH527]|uniref:hypothetical protein n=1 Tax=Planctomicrobium sp. SH527 TaxID=3448123 RepID=UPI003F5C3A6E
MATLTDYKGLDVVTDATGDGGIALTDNFKELADRAPYQASNNPGTNDDSSKGFSPGDQWLNTSTQVFWTCISSSAGAAVWKSILKRTATVLELIPQETTEGVQVAGNLQVNGVAQFEGATFNSPVQTQAGSAAAPGLQVGPLAQGFYQVDANTLGLAINGADKVNFTSAGSIISRNNNVSNSPSIMMEHFRSDAASNAAFVHRKYRGTQAAPAAVTMGTMLGAFAWQPYNGSSNAGTASIVAEATENFSPSAMGTRLRIQTIPTGQATRIDSLRCLGPRVGVNMTSDPTASLDVDGDTVRLRTAKTPASASATGNQGDICWDGDYVYVCVAANTWKRAALTTW